MDFTSQLANFRRTAGRAAASSSLSAPGRGRGGRGGQDDGGRKRGRSDRDDDDSDGGGGGRRAGDGQIRDWSRHWHRHRHRHRQQHHYQHQHPHQHPHQHLYNSRRGRGGHGRRWGDGDGDGGGGEDEEMRLRSLVNGLPMHELPPLQSQSLPPPTPTAATGKRRHLALLFLTIDDLPFEGLWKSWLSGAGCSGSATASSRGGNGRDGDDDDANDDDDDEKMMVSVLCHAKYPERVSSPWLQTRLLAKRVPSDRGGGGGGGGDGGEVRYHSRRPEWGSVEIARAMIDLVDEALKIGASHPRAANGSGGGSGGGDGNDDHDDLDHDDDDDDERLSTRRYLATSLGKFAERDPRALAAPIPPVDAVVFVSETCLPCTTLDEAEMALFGERRSGARGEGKVADSDADADADADAKPDGKASEDLPPPPPPPCRADAGKSWVNARCTPNNGYARQLQWDKISPAIPSRYIWKADQWIALIRPHAVALSAAAKGRSYSGGKRNAEEADGAGGGRRWRGKNESERPPAELWQAFRRVKASDEMYFPTVMSLLGIIRSADGVSGGENAGGEGSSSRNSSSSNGTAPSFSSSPSAAAAAAAVVVVPPSDVGRNIAKRRVTYCDWSLNGRNPESFDPTCPSTLNDVMRKAREEGCLFARKFTRGTGGAIGGSSVGGGGTTGRNARTIPGSDGTGTGTGIEAWTEAIRQCGKNRWFPNVEPSARSILE